jgi:hypothetical protein
VTAGGGTAAGALVVGGVTAGGGTIAGVAGGGAMAGEACGGAITCDAGGGSMAGEAGGASMSGEAGGGAEPGKALGGVGATGASGVCGTVLGGDGLKTGGGGGGTGLTVCARAWPMAKAAIIAASDRAASSTAVGRSNPVACIPISFGWSFERPHRQEIGSRASQTIRSFIQGI